MLFGLSPESKKNKPSAHSASLRCTTMMMQNRVIPCLQLKGDGLVKTEKFRNPRYVGDPINAVKIFNTKEVDELIFLDIMASKLGHAPNYEMIANIASECFMPFCYGGGIRSVEEAKRILNIGAEKVSVNATALRDAGFIRELSKQVGSQSVVISMDVKRTLLGRYELFDHRINKPFRSDPVRYAKEMEKSGAGEILVNSVDRDGMVTGFDLKLVKMIADQVSIPVIACGGAGDLSHFKQAVESGASAVAAGSMFVFIGKHKAVLINYPEYKEITSLFN